MNEIQQCFERPLDGETLSFHASVIAETYPFIRLSYLGKSLYGHPIPMFTFGEGGEKTIIYVGGHHGMEWLCGAVLLRFLYELGESYRRATCVWSVNPRFLFGVRRLCVIPILNPDGTELSIHGLAENNPMKDRLLRFNGGSMDFSHWQANGRGVDLNHNYNAGFAAYKEREEASGIADGAPTRFSGEYPESEPEVSALCSFLRSTEPSLLLTLHSQGEEIYMGSTASLPCGSQLARRVSALTGYRLQVPEGAAAYGGLTDWITGELRCPAFTLECGKGENPLPLSAGVPIWRTLCRLLFKAPTLV